jgi:hypothetical protein
MPDEGRDLPAGMVESVTALWQANFETEPQAIASGRFRILCHICSSVYPEIMGSRLAKSPTRDFDRQRLQQAIRRFFRWTGAPWHTGSLSPSAEWVARQLHAAFLARKVKRTYLVPLDRLALEDDTKRPCESLKHLRFGCSQILFLEEREFADHFPIDALRRFETRYWFEPEKYAGYHYLLLSDEERAGAICERNGWSILHLSRDEINKIKLYESVYPGAVENALFVVLLSLLKNPLGESEKPFGVPWVYSVTDDPFSEPPRAPDSSTLSWTIMGDDDHQQEVPDRSNFYSFEGVVIEKALERRLKRLEAALSPPEADGTFNPLTTHFFLKAFADEGIDELVSQLSCLEATLMLRGERNGKEKMMARSRSLLDNDAAAFSSLEGAYRLRNKYLHSLGNREDTTSWKDLAKIRCAVAQVVDRYLVLTEAKKADNRKALLRSLEE